MNIIVKKINKILDEKRKERYDRNSEKYQEKKEKENI